MRAWLDDGDVRLYRGHTLDVLRALPAASVDCIVTSPPYYGLRDYGVDGQIGLEATPAEFLAALVAVFRECRRVLADHGTCWVNMGDSYASGEVGRHDDGWVPGPAAAKRPPMEGHQKARAERRVRQATALPAKNLLGMPWLLALALREPWRECLTCGNEAHGSAWGVMPGGRYVCPTCEAVRVHRISEPGWILRRDVIWSKPNPMPESVTDRCTSAHEYVFMLTKPPRYWYDADAVREPNQPDGRKKTTISGSGPGETAHENYAGREGADRWPNPSGRNLRSVWEIATQPTPEAHFATYPEELVRRCILAGCPLEVCKVCGKPRERITEHGEITSTGGSKSGAHASNMDTVSPLRQDPAKSAYNTGEFVARAKITLGWSDCGHGAYRKGCVLDPFIGSGTTCKAARDHGRHSIGIDLNAAYLAIAAKRLQQLSLINQEGAA